MQNNKREYYKLFIDESGTANPKDSMSEVYILSGCSVSKVECINIKNWADQIKFKYWGRTNIIFHSREISRREGDFSILKNEEKYNEFIQDLAKFLELSEFRTLYIIVDKQRARQAGWNDKKIYKDTTIYLVKNFLLTLLNDNLCGEMIIESASAEKDKYLLDAFAYFLGAGISELKINQHTIQDTITSVSFVTKKNNDIEEQIADLFGYAAKISYFKQKRVPFKEGLYEKMITNLLDKKMFVVPNNHNLSKNKLLSYVNPFLVLP